MAKTKISEFSSTPANNTDIDSINIAEGCAPSGINDAIRELMAQLKDFQTGAQGDSFNGPIGTSTAAAGAFTTLSATGAITSTLATGSAPLVIASTTKVANLNVDLLDGADWASPAALGSTTPAAGSFTTLGASSTATLNTLVSSGATLTGGTINGMTIGATTASTGAFTTLAASSSVTLSGGTANGVTYLNGSKVLTSGSSLTYDGTSFKVAGQLYVKSDANYLAMLNADDSTYWGRITQNGSNIEFFNRQSGGLVFGASDAEQMRLTSTGLGIGTSSPSYKLDVASTAGTVANFDSTNANGPGLRFGRSGTANGYVGSAKYIVGGALADFGIDVSGANNLIFGTNDVERMRLDSAGNLGLGVTPSAWVGLGGPALQLGGASANIAGNTQYFNITANAYYASGYKYIGTGNATYYSQEAGKHLWFTAASGTAGNAISFTQAATLTASGEWLVGATSTVNAAKAVFSFSSSNNGVYLVDSTGVSGAQFMRFDSTSNTCGSITRVGTTSAVLYNTSSDYRLKNIIGPITTSGAYIDSLNPVEGTWKADGSTFVGLIAHEVQEASRTQVATGTKDGAEMQSMDYSNSELIANLIAEVKSLRQRVATLEAK